MIENKEKSILLYKYIKELTKLTSKTVTDVRQQDGFFSLHDIPTEGNALTYNGYGEEEAPFILSVRKPDFDKCPEPPPVISRWLHPGSANYRNDTGVYRAAYKERSDPDARMTYTDDLPSHTEEDDLFIEYFSDMRARDEAYREWAAKREAWRVIQKAKERERDFFTKLFHIHAELERENETLELTVGNGILRDREDTSVFHPLLLRKVKTEFDSSENTIRIVDTDSDSYIYTALLQECEGMNLDVVRDFKAELSDNDYHPLDAFEASRFLESFIHKLSPESIFSQGIPERWEASNRFLVFMLPVFFVRKRREGAASAIDRIIENIEQTGYLPPHLEDIVSGGKIDIPAPQGVMKLEERLASVGGEAVDIFLAKEANREQLEIAKRIEDFNAVLVQGPPGTGKTHTIANLLGHFLSQGKSVLVSSHTKKALRVLKDKLDPKLRSLCVSMLDDSSEDMERSVDGITDKMSATTSFELKKLLDSASAEREAVISELAETRKSLYSAIWRERNDIYYEKKFISPSDMASFVFNNAKELSYIPGEVKYSPEMPLTFAELASLYRSNLLISGEDELELVRSLPDPENFFSPEDFALIPERLEGYRRAIDENEDKNGWNTASSPDKNTVLIDSKNVSLTIKGASLSSLGKLSEKLSEFSDIPDWAIGAAIDGKRKGASLTRWTSLISLIKNTNEFSESISTELFENDVKIDLSEGREAVGEALEKLGEKYAKSGKLSLVDKLVLSSYINTARAVKINGKEISSKEDCSLAVRKLALDEKRERCAKYWDTLFEKSDIPRFFSLDEAEPERIALTFIPEIEKYLYWFDNEYEPLVEYITAAGIDANKLFKRERLTSDADYTAKVLETVKNTLPGIVAVCTSHLEIKLIDLSMQKMQKELSLGNRVSSKICKELCEALASKDTERYAESYENLRTVYEKYSLCKQRNEYLEKIAEVAPIWAEAIRSRDGIHGAERVPDNIEEAWKWKQYCGLVNAITGVSLEDLNQKSLELSRKYRKLTAKCAEYSAWYHLLLRTECDLDTKQALQGWRLTIKKIGKGTGKKASAYRAKARELMAKCQSAVPAWIMPMNKALESLDPKNNRFDILIVDEASQSDISALALTYLAKKVIIVGDDRQVSPMAVGIEIDKSDALEQEYIKDVIPNYHLYNAKTSLYDIAATTFRPLMLREHFRCVPEIIGFSNKLSYDGKIKPLRDSGTARLSPAVVSVKVEGGRRDDKRKTNPKEAETIVSLIKDCLSREEYAEKTFGVISLLGDDQAKEIQNLIFRELEPSVIEERRILCGNASHFQGDERDVIFLSMVDSSDGRPLSLLSFGVEDSVRKRYNVAVSRAKDQLFIVHSLDPASELKDGDIRRTLLEYARGVESSAVNPAADTRARRITSELEEEIIALLEKRSYAFEQNVKIGAYTLDTVVGSGSSRVAIEFDGKGVVGSETRISDDMETQTILERIGWRFIRVRGSEYYLDPTKAQEKLIASLESYGVFPEDDTSPDDGDTPPEDANADMVAEEQI